MTCASNRGGALAALAALLLLARAAHATPADDAFKRGRDLMKAGKYAEACTAFAESQKLDPSLGTQFNIAQCQEKTGKLASALKIYRDLAQYDTNDTRKAAAAALAEKLAARVSEIRIHLDPPAPGAVIFLDGAECKPCLTGPNPVDLGKLAIVVRAPGFKPAARSEQVDEEGKLVVVTITLEPGTDPIPVGQPPPPRPIPPPVTGAPPPVTTSVTTSPRSNRKLTGIIVAGSGAVLLGTGVVFGLLANTRWSEARDVCGGSSTCANDSDTDFAQRLADSARTRAHISTALFIAGGLASAAGIYLWATSPKERAVTVSATATPGGGGVVLGGRF